MIMYDSSIYIPIILLIVIIVVKGCISLIIRNKAPVNLTPAVGGKSKPIINDDVKYYYYIYIVDKI